MIGIVAVNNNWVMGHKGKLPWYCPEDFKWFKFITTGKTVIMGRKTYESISKNPLPNRHNIIISRSNGVNDHRINGTYTHDVDAIGGIYYDAFVIGGAEIYKLFANLIDTWYVSFIRNDVQGDMVFPRTEILGKFKPVSELRLSYNCAVKKYIKQEQCQDQQQQKCLQGVGQLQGH